MPEMRPADSDFLNKVTALIEKNISNEQFGVSELAAQVGMSRSNLLRKLRKLTNLSVSQFIRQVRLQHAMHLLKEGFLSVSEVSFQVGFNSTSYFIKCFREHFGYPPGEVISQPDAEEKTEIELSATSRQKKFPFAYALLFLLIVVGIAGFLVNPWKANDQPSEKSIAVLPFKNDSEDSTNIYIINGLMESVLNNLQKIKDLRVVSRTSVEKYRNSGKTLPEIADELNVNYFIEGSGQKRGDQILLTIQLVEGPNDKNLWAEQYSRETSDIFNLQMEVAKNIAGQIEAIITPQEKQLIETPPTDNLMAYDFFLKALEHFHAQTKEGLEKAIPLFEKAIAEDPEFAQAYADAAIAYYLLEINQAERENTSIVNAYSDKALFYDDHLPEAFLAKAYFYMANNENALAEPYLLKAVEYAPNSSFILNTASDFYTSRIPNTKKYLEFAIRGIQIDIASNDSTSASYIYLHVSNAFIQSGFVSEAETYINKSIESNPNNLFSAYVKPYILYAKNKNLEALNQQLLNVFQRDTSRIDLLQEVAKSFYYLRDYPSAYNYYKKFLEMRESMHLNVYPYEDAKMGYVLNELGKEDEATALFEKYYRYAMQDRSIYKNLSLAVYYSYQNQVDEALKHLSLFSQQANFQYWVLLFLKDDPLIDNVKGHPEFQKIFKQMERNFWNTHREIQKSLKRQNLI